MAKRVQLTNEEGFVSTVDLGDATLTIDGSGAETPDTLDHLLGVYAACYVPALRVGAEQRDIGELGAIEITATGQTNESDKLASIAFDITTDAGLDGEAATRLRERAHALCKVHDALKESLHATVTVDGHET